MFKFQKLNVWVKAKDFGKQLYQISDRLPSKYRFSFSDQLVRAGLSITNNIAEGSGRLTQIDQRHFFVMAKGSVYEVVNILIVLSEMGFILNEKLELLIDQADEICRMLSGLIKQR
jgi:four helix bundle protein